GTMQRPPRPRGQRLLDLPLALRAYGFLGLIEAGVVMGVFLQVLVDAGWRWPQTLGAQDPVYRSATTAALCALILLQVVNVYLCRSSWRSVLATGLGGNRWIAAGVALELTLLGFFAFTPWGHALLGTAAPPASVWGSIALGAFAMLAAEEARKAWLRRRAIEGVNPASASAR
ncbi:MAG TPA: cation-translocating P-type ATPase C-terminal domain-containing protein, partial [Burkholderiaceae bacterium]|nr:cation-translocating P-type ATPase C-terminal domain-containing protein [Burkholderiaceae bacterium]